MLWHLFAFEARYFLTRLSTWVYWGIFFALSLLMMLLLGGAFPGANAAVGGTDGNVWVNSPYVLALLTGQMGLFAVLVTAALAGHAGYRDFGDGIYPLFFTTPLSKWSWLGGRYLAVVLVNMVVLTSVPIGLWVGTLMPMVDPERFGAPGIVAYLQPMVLFVLPNVMFASALFLTMAAVTRSRLPHYIGGVGLLLGYMIGNQLTSNLDTEWIATLADPFGFEAVGQVTRYWTMAERNQRSPGLTSWILYNRVLWLSVSAVLTLGLGRLVRFNHSGVRLWGRAKKRDDRAGAPEARALVAPRALRLPEATLVLGRAAWWPQLRALTARSVSEIIRNAYFGAILGGGVLFLVISGLQVGEIYGTSTWPVTYQVLELLGGSFSLFVLIILTFYAGELVWNERDLKVQQLTDTLPVSNTLLFLSRLAALLGVLFALQFVVLFTGLLTQALNGYTRFELGLYLRTLFAMNLLDYALLAVLALAIHTLVNHKYVGHFVMVLFYAFTLFMGSMGLEHTMIRYGSDIGQTYSDMNAYAPFIGPFYLYKAYWGGVALLLALLSNLFWVRGQDGQLRTRARLAQARLSTPILAGAGLALAISLASGGAIFYNTNVQNDYQTSWDAQEERANYERDYKQYEGTPLPRITAANVEVDIFPQAGDVKTRGALTLQNKTLEPLSTVIISWNATAEIGTLALDRPGQVEIDDTDAGFRLISLDAPMQPGEQATLSFDLAYPATGFSNGGPDLAIVENGTFFNNWAIIPGLGYQAKGELVLDQQRKKHGLEPKERMPDLDDEAARANTYLSADSDWVDFETVVSTSPDQIAIAPGYLQREWEEGGRRYFHYKMDAPILNFYSFLSARYEVVEDRWNDVAIEVYHHPGHEYNVERMIDATKKSLDYYTAHFSPYQHRQVRILEFPRYATFAQSFPNTIPYSESIGFIARVGDEDIDYPFYVTAHEVAHQWWAHQVIGANVQGGTVMSETLSQYAALMVMEQEFGADQIHKFLAYELRNYLTGRAGERKKELPLMRVENQPYIHYNKGAIAMYAIKDAIGEEALNGALRDYIAEVGFQQPPYTTSRDLVAHIEAATPPELRYLIDDWFRTITLYENKATAATAAPSGDGYTVEIQLESRKYRAGEQGEEEDVALDDWIDIGVFGDDEHAPPLYLEKHRITSAEQTITVVVSEEPAEAAIDPYSKLIDRQSDDNRVDVELP